MAAAEMEALLIIIVVAVVLFGISTFLNTITDHPRSPQVKGEIGEARVISTVGRNLPAEIYHQFHDVTLPTSYGTVQIDHIIVSRFGIFVIETKNLKGWIFGGSNHPQWTQVLFHESYKFQNPIHQNYTHIRALKTLLNVSSRAIYSVIAFVGNSTFKTPMPDNVKEGGDYISYIKSFRDPVMSESEVYHAVSQIHRARLEPSRDTDRQHVTRLMSRPRSSCERKCPLCGHAMILRTAKTGFRAGNRFWGCSRYPRCRGILNIS